MLYAIAFSGKIGSGKSSISQLMAKNFNFQRVSFGDYVRKIATERNIEHSRFNLQNLGESLMSENPNQFCRNVLNQVSAASDKPLIIDGIRHKISLDEIKTIIYPNKIFHIHIEVREEVRLERIIQRQDVNPNEIEMIDAHPSEKQVTLLFSEIADLVINSENDIEQNLEIIEEWLRINVSTN
jgi:dephospho-CoA kinase